MVVAPWSMMSESVAARKLRDMEKLSAHIDGLYQKPKLRRLFWEATTQCNLSCLHCGSDCSNGEAPDYTSAVIAAPSNGGRDFINREPPDSLTYEEMRVFLNQFAKDFSPREVMLCVTGGEPLMRRDLFDVMVHAASLGFVWGMTTNGLLLTDSIIKDMVKTNCKTISVSLDGLKDSHNALRGRDCFEQTLDGIRALMAARCFSHVQVTTVLSKRNIHELSDMYALMETLRVDSWRLTNLEPIGRANQMEGDFLEAEDFRTLFDFIRSHRKNWSKVPVTFGCSHYVTPEYEMDIRDYFFICGAGILTASILYNGDIFACLDIERKYGLVQGNIRKDNFTEVWEKGFSQFRQRRDMLNPDCAACSDARYCRGDSAHTWDFDKHLPKCCLKRLI